MHSQGYSLLLSGYKKTICTILLLALFIAVTCNLSPITYAQEVSPTTKKNVVKNFKVNLSEYSAFGSDCSKKPEGDANCDGRVNEFDLSIWEVEFSTSNNPRRSDFNNDGAVNLLDFGIWRKTIYPSSSSTTSSKPKFLSTLIDLLAEQGRVISKQIPITQFLSWDFGYFLGQLEIRSIRNYLAHLPNFSLPQALAQETASGGGEINSSETFIYNSGNSTVVNQLEDNMQQINFNSNGNPTSAQFFDTNGNSFAEVAFESTGGTIIATQESGIPIIINKTSTGPIIENFRNPDGSLLAIKSWPTQQSYNRNEPPLSVTIPGQGATKEVLNMQPNGDAIVEKLDAVGNTMSRTQLRSNGTVVTEDLLNKTIVQSNSEIGFTNLSMKNNIGGNTEYMFYEGALFAIVQSTTNNNAYVAKPLDTTGDSWSFETLEGGVRRAEKTVTNPITETNSNTPDPKTLIQYINYYKQATPNTNAVNFSDGFTSTTPAITNPVTKANAILTISQTPAPAVLGIIKEANAQSSAAPPPPNTPQVPSGYTATYKGASDFASGDGWTYQWDLTKDGQYAGNIQAQLPSLTNSGVTDPNPATQSFGQITLNLNGKETETSKVGDLQTLQGLYNHTGTFSTNAFPSFADSAPAPAPAAPRQDLLSQPLAPLQGAPTITNRTEALEFAGKHADAAETPMDARNAMTAALNEANRQFDSRGITDKQFSKEEVSLMADEAFVSAYVSSTFNLDLTDPAQRATAYSNGHIQTAIDRLNANLNTAGLPPSNITVGNIHTPAAGTTDPSRPASVAPAAAAVAAAGPAVGTQYQFNNQFSATVTKNENGTTTSTIAGTAHGTATFTNNPTTGATTYSDNRGTFSANAGSLTAASFSDTGVSLSIQNGSLVNTATGELASSQEVAQWNAQAREQGLATGALQTGFFWDDLVNGGNGGYVSVTSHVQEGGGFCFLPGTLISTPNGQKPIETLTPNDKVYSYDEKTGAKEISTFKELDINFVDEYLIINNQIKTTTYHPFYIVSSEAHPPLPHPTDAPLEPPLKGEGNETIPLSLRERVRERGMPSSDDILVTVRADELKLGDILQNEAGKYVPVYSIEKVIAPKTTVYNLNDVSKNNNFFAEGILVHNYGADDEAQSGINSYTSETWDSSSGYGSMDSGTNSDSTGGGIDSNVSDPGQGDSGSSNDQGQSVDSGTTDSGGNNGNSNSGE